MKLKYSGYKLQETIDSLRENKIPFELQQTTYTMKLKFLGKEREFIQGGNLNGYELNFIKTVKNHIKEKFPNVPNIYKPEFYRYNFLPTCEHNFYEIDLSGAYWKTAFLLGYISEEIFNLPKTINEKAGKEVIRKHARLVSLGTLAKKTFTIIFDGKENKYIEPEPLPTEGIFFHIAEETSLIMATCADIIGNDFLFFWVDAMFCKPQSENQVKEIFTFFKYDFKTKFCEHSFRKGNFIFVKKTGETGLIQYPLTRKKLLYA